MEGVPAWHAAVRGVVKSQTQLNDPTIKTTTTEADEEELNAPQHRCFAMQGIEQDMHSQLGVSQVDRVDLCRHTLQGTASLVPGYAGWSVGAIQQKLSSREHQTRASGHRRNRSPPCQSEAFVMVTVY